MNNRSILCGMRSIVFASMVTFAAPGAALAAHSGGAHGGGGWAYSGHFDSRIGAYGAGYHGWRGAYGYYGGSGWDGLGYDLFFATVPLYYSTLWWNSVPYYYADANYYAWNSAVGEFETVRPAPQVQSQIATQESTGADVFAYPKNGQ